MTVYTTGLQLVIYLNTHYCVTYAESYKILGISLRITAVVFIITKAGFTYGLVWATKLY